MRLTKPLVILFRVLTPTLVIMGIGFWTGHWAGLIPMHRILGVAFVVTLWAIAITVLANGNPRRRLAVFAIVWGVVIAALGMTQQRILVGNYHWIVRALHLVVAIAAMRVVALLTTTKQPAT
jgi:hypothetical protein